MEVINESQSITSSLSKTRNPTPNLSLHAFAHLPSRKLISAATLIGYGGTNPSLDTIHDKHNRIAPANAPQRLARLSQQPNAARNIPHAVFDCRGISVREAPLLGKFGDGGGGGKGGFYGDCQGVVAELPGVGFDRRGVRGEGLEAEWWVCGGGARGFDEVCVGHGWE